MQGQRAEVRNCAARRAGEGPWASQEAATANSCRSRDSEKEVRGGGQKGRGPRMQNNSFADKLRGNTTRKAEAALQLLFHSLRRQVCPGDEHPGSIAAGVCHRKQVALPWKSGFRGGWRKHSSLLVHKGALVTT